MSKSVTSKSYVLFWTLHCQRRKLQSVLPQSQEDSVVCVLITTNKYLGKLSPEDSVAQLALISAHNLPCFLFLEAAWGMQPHTHIHITAMQPDNMCQSLLKATGWAKHMLLSSRTIQSDVCLPAICEIIWCSLLFEHPPSSLHLLLWGEYEAFFFLFSTKVSL